MPVAFRVKKMMTDGREPGDIVNATDYPEYERLVGLGVLELMDGVELPKREATNEELMAEIRDLHDRIVVAEAEADRCKKETAQVAADATAKLKVSAKELEACYAEFGNQEKLFMAEKQKTAELEKVIADERAKRAQTELQLADAIAATPATAATTTPAAAAAPAASSTNGKPSKKATT